MQTNIQQIIINKYVNEKLYLWEANGIQQNFMLK